MTRILPALVALFSVACTAPAAEQPLRILQSTDQAVTIGTDAFSVTVHSSGRMDALQAGGVKYVSFIALYTSPSSFQTGKGVRAVQGETGEDRGIGPLPDSITAEKRGDRYFIAINRTAARKEICDGQPLYELHQTVEIAPNGVLRARYEFNWLRFCRIGRPTIYVALATETFADLTFWADYTTRCQHGAFSEGEDYAPFTKLKGPLRTMRVDCPAGPFDLWIDAGSSVTSTRWGERYNSIGLYVPKASGMMYPGVTSVVQFTIKVPL